MPYRIQWYVEGRVILEEAFGDVTMEELVRFNAEVTTLIAEEGVAPVHVIVDLSKVEKYPPSLREVLSTMRQKAPEKVGWMLIVTESPILRFVASTVFQIAHLKLRTFATLPQAKTFLAEMDDTVAMSR
ncbi:MAG: hypothetical protein GC204_13810 [Chloroflexi bacterium]|nr:hypothetical protein [Chloroflexota bacterium]